MATVVYSNGTTRPDSHGKSCCNPSASAHHFWNFDGCFAHEDTSGDADNGPCLVTIRNGTNRYDLVGGEADLHRSCLHWSMQVDCKVVGVVEQSSQAHILCSLEIDQVVGLCQHRRHMVD